MWHVKLLNVHGDIVEEAFHDLDAAFVWLEEVIGQSNIKSLRISNSKVTK